MNVLVFARLRELLGAGEVWIEATDATTAGSVRASLTSRYPQAETLLAKCLVAVNNEYVGENSPVSPTDAVALIPPVSGG